MRKIKLLGLMMMLTSLTGLGQTNKIENTGSVGIGTTSPQSTLHVTTGQIGINTTHSKGIFEGLDCHLDLISSPEATWGSSLNFVEGNGTSNIDIWSIVRQTTTGLGNSSLNFNFGTNNHHLNSTKLTLLSNGNIGIGTADPKALLHVCGKTQSILSSTTDNNYFQYRWNPSGDQAYIWSSNADMKFGTASGYNAENWSEKLRITSDGNVGIGTSNPKAKLEVKGDIAIPRTYKFKFLEKENGGDRAYIRSSNGENGETFNSLIFAVGAGNERLFINGNTGKIGIGTKQPEHELDVCGTVRAKEVKVEEFTCSNAFFDGILAANNITVKANGNTADFVFEDSYQLKDLSEVETFIKTNKHLPDIPSAAQMEEQGVNLAEMNKMLLQKVEELMLYTIEQKKEINKQKSEVERLEGERKKEQGEREELQKALSEEQSARSLMEEKVTSVENELKQIKELINNKLK